jgi:hypothetical protein
MLSGISFSQSPEHATSSTETQQNQEFINSNIYTLDLNLRNVSRNDQGALRDDLTRFESHIIKLEYDEVHETILLIHSKYITKEEVLFLLEKHAIPNANIVSYQ